MKIVTILLCIPFWLSAQNHTVFNYGISANTGFGFSHIENNIAGFLSFKGHNLLAGISYMDDKRDSQEGSSQISNNPLFSLGYKGLLLISGTTYLRASIETQLIKTRSSSWSISGRHLSYDEAQSLNAKLGIAKRIYSERSNHSFDLDFGIGVLGSKVITDLYLFLGISVFIKTRP